MKHKPKGPKYRNLYARGGVIYYERVTGRIDEGKPIRKKLSTKTSDWEVAASFRDLYEQTKGIGSGVLFLAAVPTFEEFAKRYLKEDTAHLAETTRRARESELDESAPLTSFFGEMSLDEITSAQIREWWTAKVQEAGRSTKTGRNYLDTLSGVLGYAMELKLIQANPVDEFRLILRRKMRTQRGRAESAPDRDIRPIESPENIDTLLSEAKAEGESAYLLVLLLLDAGLRLGEALGLRWAAVIWGNTHDDLRRALLIDESRPKGLSPGPTKSGRARKVALSRRLRAALAGEYRRQFEPGPERHVLGNLQPDNFRHREWRLILKRADIGHVRLKDLRDTYASQLLTCGVQLGYISAQLGHADVGVTARHYARWAGGDAYREPMRVEPGEMPADLLARLAPSHQIPTTSPAVDFGEHATHWNSVGNWRAQHDSNMRPSGPQPDALSN